VWRAHYDRAVERIPLAAELRGIGRAPKVETKLDCTCAICFFSVPSTRYRSRPNCGPPLIRHVAAACLFCVALYCKEGALSFSRAAQPSPTLAGPCYGSVPKYSPQIFRVVLLVAARLALLYKLCDPREGLLLTGKIQPLFLVNSTRFWFLLSVLQNLFSATFQSLK
jgi:hypothetical protein